MIYLQLFLSYLKIGVFGFGGGYAMLSLIQHEVVINREWISNAEFTDIVAISQITPGPIAINSATYIGYTVSGNIFGAMVATLAVCVPSLVIMLAITKFYIALNGNRYVQAAMFGMQPMVIAMIAAAALLLLTPDTFVDWISWVILGVSFIAAAIAKVNPILIIVLSGVAGYLIYGL